MATLNVDTINNSAGTGAPDFPNGVTVNSKPFGGIAAYSRTTTSASIATGNPIPFAQNEIFSYKSVFTKTSDSRITVNFDGVVKIHGSVSLATIPTTSTVRLYKNGVFQAQLFGISNDSGENNNRFTFAVEVVATDYLELWHVAPSNATFQDNAQVTFELQPT